jgi:hypothetical protein
MRKRIGNLMSLLMISVMLVALIGCGIERVPVEKSLPKIDTVSGSSLELTHDIEGFKFKTSYNVGNYKFDRWRITDSKNIFMNAITQNLPEGDEVMVEHVHIDISLKATSPQLDGLTQDSMDDSYHGYSQDGFAISNKYAYENTFAIEGFSKDLIEGWSFYCGDYGEGHTSSYRLTEESLIRQGTYANKLTIVYDLLIKHKGDTQYHTKSIVDEFLIPTKADSSTTK